MASDAQYLPIEVTIATNYVISFLYNKLPRRRVDVFAEELSSVLHKKLNASSWLGDSHNGGSSPRTVRIAVSPPLEIDVVVTDAIRSSGLTVEEVVQELPLAMSLFIENGEVSYCIGSNHAEPIPIYSTRRVLSEGGGLNGQGAFLNPSVDAVGLLDGVDPNLLALLSIRPLGNNSSAQVPTAVFAQTKFGSTKFRSQTSGSARRPSRLNGGAGGNGQGSQQGQSADSPVNHGGRNGVGSNGGSSNGSSTNGNNSVVRGSNASTPSSMVGPGWSQNQQQQQQQQSVISPTSRYQSNLSQLQNGSQQSNGVNENVFSSPALPPVVTSAAAAVLASATSVGGMGSCGNGSRHGGNNSTGQGNNGYRTPSSDFAFLLQDLQGCGSTVSSPALSEFPPSLTSSFDGVNHMRMNGHALSNNHNHGTSAQRHSYHGNGSANNIPNGSALSSSSAFFPSASAASTSTIGSLLFDSGITSPSSSVAASSSWSSSTPVSTSVTRDKHNTTFSDHSNSSSTSSSGSLSLFNGSLNGHCDSWGLGSHSSNVLPTSVFSDTNAALTGTQQWVQSLRLAAVTGPGSAWDQLTATES